MRTGMALKNQTNSSARVIWVSDTCVSLVPARSTLFLCPLTNPRAFEREILGMAMGDSGVLPNRIHGSSRSGAGTILRIRMENFMCHSNLRIELGEWVNFITGQNGSTSPSLLSLSLFLLLLVEFAYRCFMDLHVLPVNYFLVVPSFCYDVYALTVFNWYWWLCVRVSLSNWTFEVYVGSQWLISKFICGNFSFAYVLFGGGSSWYNEFCAIYQMSIFCCSRR